MMPIWAVFATAFGKELESFGKLTKALGGWKNVFILATFFAGFQWLSAYIGADLRAEKAHLAHVESDQVAAKRMERLEVLAVEADVRAKRAEERELLSVNLMLEACISGNETADRSRKTCEDIASGRLRYVR
jgi:hypothetical protein